MSFTNKILNYVKEKVTLFNVVDVIISVFLLGVISYHIFKISGSFESVAIILLVAMVYGAHCRNMIWMKYGYNPAKTDKVANNENG
ncbi:hypothetical protein PBI_SCTP2_408 [Salicola phage SCTP-2]|nr:hypothetical protein PBI_SCTP2_408 [Salicola phage SCTP-2]